MKKPVFLALILRSIPHRLRWGTTQNRIPKDSRPLVAARGLKPRARKTLKISIFIFLLAALLRFYKLGEIPPALDVDEAPIGYNAYSILKTGRDEYGKFLPLSFRMLDDYRPPLYTYLAALGIKFFGLNEFAVRLPSALVGILMVVVIYFLTRELFKKTAISHQLSTISSFLLAVNPWAIHFSRFASEANLSLFFILLGVFLFFKAKKMGILLILPALAFALSAYTYQAARFFAPLTMLLLTIIFLNPWKKNFSKILVFFLSAFCFVLPLITLFFKNPTEHSIRFRGISLFGQEDVLEKSAKRILWHQENGSKIVGLIFDNRRLFYFKKWLKFYLEYFSPSFLFFGDPNRRHHAPDVGHFYLLDIIFLLIGMFVMVKKFLNQQLFWLLLFWIILPPAGAAFVWGGPNAGRAIFMLLGLLLITSLGFQDLLKKSLRGNRVLLTPFFFYFFGFLFYLDSYFFHLPKELVIDWNWHHKKAALESQKEAAGYSKIVVSNSLSLSYVSFLFYLKYEPSLYLQQGGTVSGMFTEKRNHFDKYYFCPLNYKSLANNEQILFVGKPQEFEFLKKEKLEIPIIMRIRDWQGEDLVWLVKGIKFIPEEGVEGDVCEI